MAKVKVVWLLLRPNVWLVIIGVVAGVTGAMAAGRLVEVRVRAAEEALNARYLPREVVVAARDLPAGEQIEAGMLARRQMPRDFLPAGALAESQAGTLIGRHLSVSLRRGEPLQPAHTYGRDLRSLSRLVRKGGRALTISVDDTNSMAGLLRAGDVVDLYYSRSQGESTVLAPLLERVEVLAAGEALGNDLARGQAPSEGSGAFSTLTVHVTSEDAARVVLAQSSGTLTVLLRSPVDEEPVAIATRNSRNLLARRQSGTPGVSAPAESIDLIVGGSGAVIPEVSRLTVGTMQARRTGGRT